MNTLGKVAGVNLLILFIYMISIYFSNGNDEWGILFTAAMCIVVHVIINVIAGIISVRENKALSRAFFLSAVLVLVIGFSSCWGSIAL